MTIRQQKWAGAAISIAAQGVLFLLLDHFLGHWISALFVLVVNIGLAASYKNTNAYLQGARWATLLTLGLVSVARHGYWADSMLETFVRLSSFSRPLDWTTELCQGNLEAGIIVGSTSALLLVFYYFTTRWPEWTDRWEMLRRAPFTASLGFQTIIVTVVVYPTPLTVSTALFFAGVVSPLLRRQVRLNHIVFLMLTPLFSLAVPSLAAFWGLICGIIFLYFVAAERSLTDLAAAFSLFNGVVFIALTFSTMQNWVASLGSVTLTGLYSLVCFIAFMGVSYIFLTRGEQSIRLLRSVLMGLVPSRVRESDWWAMRDLWVDREVAHRVGKLFKWSEQEKTIGYFIFGPKAWAPWSEVYDRVPFPHPNLAPVILVLPLYAFFQGVDSVLFLTTGQLWVTLGGLGLVFLTILGAPLVLMGLKRYTILSKLTAGFSLVILALYMYSIVYFGFSSTDNLSEAAANFSASTGQAGQAGPNAMLDSDCTCVESEKPLGLPGLDGK